MSSAASPDDDPEDPISYFLQDLVYHGKTERTRDAYDRALRDFEDFLRDPERNPTGTSTVPAEATHRHCMAWVHGLRGRVASSTVATYAAYLHRFYAYMTQVGVFDANPVTLVMEEMDEQIDTDPTRRELSVAEMRAFVGDIRHPLDRAVVVTLLKTGMRVGELCNLDLRDLKLTDSPASTVYDLGSRAQLDGKPDSLYVSSDPARGAVSNGEERTASNKRKRSTVVPVDDELKWTLERWLAVRPDALSDAEPLFLGVSNHWGRRLTTKAARRIVTQHAKAAGWHRAGGDASENVTPHYFRHFFTTHLRDRTGDRGIVKYLRGDVAGDIIDTYTHNWGDRVRETYEEHVYSLL